MGESRNTSLRQRRPTTGTSLPTLHFPLLLLCLLLLPPPTAAFDVSSLWEILGVGGLSNGAVPCPAYCNCSTRRADDVMQDYMSRYLPDMGLHMQPKLEQEARATVKVFTSWIGSMADMQCHLPEGDRINLTDLLQGSQLSFKALRLTCAQNTSAVWDLSAFEAFVNILDVSGCNVKKAEGSETLAVPLNMWVLDLNDIQAEAVSSLDLTTGQTLLALSITNTSLTALPAHWAGLSLLRLMVTRLGHNKLDNYSCEIKASTMSSLNLDHNQLTSVPPCIMDGSRYTHHLSLRHNPIRTLEGPLTNKTEDVQNPNPYIMYLDVSHNKLDSLPALRQVEGFFSLDLSHNQLHSLAVDAFAANQILKWLDLSNNRLEFVPDGAVTVLPLLNHLNLSYNSLQSFDFDQSPLSYKVVDLDLRYNRLKYPPFADTGFVAPRLSRITAAQNPFTCDCGLDVFMSFLSALNASRNQHWFSLGYWDTYEHDPSIIKPYADVEEFRCSQPAELNDVPLHTLSFKESCPLFSGCPTECRCELKKGEEKRVIVDCSESESLIDLPAELPQVPNATIALFVNRSGLRRLDYRPYLRHLSEMHAAHSRLSSVTSGAMEALKNVRELNLENNLLRSLPAVTQNLTMAAATNISLGNNPWTCGCNDLWMPDWVEKHQDVLYDLNSMQCRWTGKKVTELDSADLNCGVFNYLPLVIALSLLLGLSVIVASLLVKYKLEVLVFLYTRFRVRPFDMYRYNHKGQVFQFDIFVSFSQHDYHWVVEKLVDQLENRVKPYRLCIHLRDFPVGAPIADSVSWAINSSRCSLLVLTKDFLQSEWCRHEFREAHARLLKDPHTKLLIVVHGPVDARNLDRELLAYLRTNTYLKTEDRWFWSKLEYTLPAPQEPRVVIRGPEEGGVVGGAMEEDMMNGGPPAAPPAEIELDTILPVAMAAGDVYPKV